MSTMEEKKSGVYPGPHRAAYELWRLGVNLKEIYPTRSYHRHKRFLMDHHQINIDVPPTA